MLIAQLSDLHVRPRGQLYRGVVDSNHMLSEAVRHLNALDRRPDLVLLTGDLVDEGRPDEYTMVTELLQPLQAPLLVLPGNHDSRPAFLDAFAGHRYLPATGPLHYCVDTHPVRIVALDSCPPGQHHGHVDAQGLAWLQRTLAADRDKPTLLLLHHPPFVSGIPYLDDYRYIEQEALAAVVAGFDNIEAVLCGHVHRPMFRRWAGTVVASCPSTTTQIALQFRADASPQSYAGPSACLLHLWQPQHGLVSHTSDIGAHPGPYPFF
ncbi:MAG: phosphodiesterase [Rubrivivax sp.]